MCDAQIRKEQTRTEKKQKKKRKKKLDKNVKEGDCGLTKGFVEGEL